MSLPVCPNCRSTAVTPDQWDSGKNVCRGCGLVAQVRDFHQEASPFVLPPRGFKQSQPRPPPGPIQRHPSTPPKPPQVRQWWQDI